MSKTLLDWINATQKKSFWYYWKLFWKEFWSNFGTKDVKINNDWKGVKLRSTHFPENNWNDLTDNQKMVIQEKHWKELNLNFQK